MQKLKISYSYGVLFGLLLLISCQGTSEVILTPISTVENTSEFSVDDAQKWFDATYGKTAARVGIKNKDRTWNWKKSQSMKIKRGSVLYEIVIAPVTIKNEDADLEHASLWVVKTNGKIESKFMELYSRNTKNKLKDKKGLNRNNQKDFTGVLTIYDITEGFDLGYYFENGKYAGIVTEFGGEKTKVATPTKSGKVSSCMPVMVCNVNNTNSTGGYIAANGTYVLIYPHCIYQINCDGVIGAVGSNGYWDPSLETTYWDAYWAEIEMNTNPFLSNISAFSPGMKPIAEYPASNRCKGLQDMWSLGVSSNNKEVYGVITKDGSLLITQVSPYTTGGQFDGIYSYQGQVYYFYPAAGNPPVSYEGAMISGGKIFIPIKATVHTHNPALLDGTDGITNNDGTDDFPFAQQFSTINHYVIGNGAVAQFNSYAYFNKQRGTLPTTCNSIN
jgi:hypothetical protein